MGYCTLAQVQTEFRSITFDGSSKVTNTKVNEIIDEESEDVDSAITETYVTPVDSGISPNAFKLMRKLALIKCSGRIHNILKKSGPNHYAAESEATLVQRLAWAERKLKRLQEGKDVLTDGVRRSVTGNVDFNEDVERSVDTGDKLEKKLW